MCKLNAQQIVSDGAVVGQALDNLAAALETTDPSLATNLKNAGQAVIAATANWQTGSTLAGVEDAEQAAIVVLNAIPLTSPFANLVAIAFAGLNLLIANSQTQTTQTGVATADAHTLLVRAAVTNVDSPWHGKATIRRNPLLHPFEQPRQTFVRNWNEEAKHVNVKEIYI